MVIDATQLHDLTILYLQNQDLSNITPTELSDRYVETRKEIKNHIVDSNKGKLKSFK
ncbi:hypothetical protein [Lactococcus lactis]|uniref:hypothetical protein n=1 Tax=Lactococcus lactis TaxID=1358 RepID=UPI002072CAAE|nr:hypothetical protein [Lactococcus lactis]